MSNRSVLPTKTRIKSVIAVLIAIAVPVGAICLTMSVLRWYGVQYAPTSPWNHIANAGDVVLAWLRIRPAG